jgi:hypothetical protein
MMTNAGNLRRQSHGHGLELELVGAALIVGAWLVLDLIAM